MIEGHEAFFLGEDGPHQFLMEVNWAPNDEKSNECKMIKVTWPAKPQHGKQQTTYVKREHLNAMLFAIGTKEDQMNLIPMREQTVRSIESTVRLKAKKDIRKGEEIITTVKLDIPVGMQDKISNAQHGKTN